MKLNYLQAYLAMVNFLDLIYWRTKNDDLGVLLGFMSPYIFEGSKPADSDVYTIWESCVKDVSNENKITADEAYQSAMIFLQLYRDKIGLELYIVLHEMSKLQNDNIDWIKSIDKALMDERKLCIIE